jgi:hypothetical protein
VSVETSKTDEKNPIRNLITNGKNFRSFSRTYLIKTKIRILKEREEPVSKFQ